MRPRLAHAQFEWAQLQLLRQMIVDRMELLASLASQTDRLEALNNQRGDAAPVGIVAPHREGTAEGPPTANNGGGGGNGLMQQLLMGVGGGGGGGVSLFRVGRGSDGNIMVEVPNLEELMLLRAIQLSLQEQQPPAIPPCSTEDLAALRLMKVQDARKQFPVSGLSPARGAGDGHGGCQQDEHSCTICISVLEDGDDCVVLPCGHIFCPNCIKEWLGRQRTCPVCRRDVLRVAEQYEEREALVAANNNNNRRSVGGGARAARLLRPADERARVIASTTTTTTTRPSVVVGIAGGGGVDGAASGRSPLPPPPAVQGQLRGAPPSDRPSSNGGRLFAPALPAPPMATTQAQRAAARPAVAPPSEAAGNVVVGRPTTFLARHGGDGDGGAALPQRFRAEQEVVAAAANAVDRLRATVERSRQQFRVGGSSNNNNGDSDGNDDARRPVAAPAVAVGRRVEALRRDLEAEEEEMRRYERDYPRPSYSPRTVARTRQQIAERQRREAASSDDDDDTTAVAHVPGRGVDPPRRQIINAPPPSSSSFVPAPRPLGPPPPVTLLAAHRLAQQQSATAGGRGGDAPPAVAEAIVRRPPLAAPAAAVPPPATTAAMRATALNARAPAAPARRQAR